MTGVSGGGGAILPALLLGADSVNSLRTKGVAAMQSTQNLGETVCYMVVVTNAEQKSVATLWIERDTYLLRRMETVIGAMTPPIPEFTAEQLAQNPQLKELKIPAIKTSYANHTVVFATRVAK